MPFTSARHSVAISSIFLSLQSSLSLSLPLLLLLLLSLLVVVVAVAVVFAIAGGVADYVVGFGGCVNL